MPDQIGEVNTAFEIKLSLPVGPNFARFTGQDIPDAALERIIEMARLAPSEWNFQPWRWIVVRGESARQQLEASTLIKVPLGSAPVILICLADSMAWKSAPQHLQEMVAKSKITEREAHSTLHMLREYYSASPEVARRAARANTFVALHQLLLSAAENGISGYWVTEFDENRVKTFFHIPDNFVVAALLPLGYREETIVSSVPRLPLQSLVYKEKFGETLNITQSN
jgi:nitroreductase